MAAKNIFLPCTRIFHVPGKQFLRMRIIEEGGSRSLGKEAVENFDRLVTMVNQAPGKGDSEEDRIWLSKTLAAIDAELQRAPHPSLHFLKGFACLLAGVEEAHGEADKFLQAYDKHDPLLDEFAALYKKHGMKDPPDIGFGMLERDIFCSPGETFPLALFVYNRTALDHLPERAVKKGVSFAEMAKESNLSCLEIVKYSCERESFAEALEVAGLAIQKEPKNAFAFLARGYASIRLALQEGKFDVEKFNLRAQAALDDFTEAIRISPGPHAHFSRAFARAWLNDAPGALEDIRILEGMIQGNERLLEFYRPLAIVRAQAYLLMEMEGASFANLMAFYKNNGTKACEWTERLKNGAPVTFFYLHPYWYAPEQSSIGN